MALPASVHTTTITELPAHHKHNFRIMCTCGFQGHAYTKPDIERIERDHFAANKVSHVSKVTPEETFVSKEANLTEETNVTKESKEEELKEGKEVGINVVPIKNKPTGVTIPKLGQH